MSVRQKIINFFKAKKNKHPKKILLATLIPITIIIIALGIFLGYWYGIKSKNDNPPPSNKSININNDTINENANYKVAAGSTIWYNVNDYKMTLGHDLIDLKALSIDHHNITNFIVDGVVDFGFLIDFDTDFSLSGINNASIQWSGNGIGCGVVVGSKLQPSGAITYSGNMNIDSNISFNISSNNDSVFGVYLGSTSTGLISINGNFILTSKNISQGNVSGVFFSNNTNSVNINGLFSITGGNTTCGVMFDSVATGSININGVFSIYGPSGSSARYIYGVYFKSAVMASVVINGTFAISIINSGSGSKIDGVYFASTVVGSSENIKGNFTISSGGYGYIDGIYFNGVAAGSSTIDGTFSISSTTADSVNGVRFNNAIADGSTQTINGIFAIYRNGKTIYDIYYYASDPNRTGTISINGIFALFGDSTYSFYCPSTKPKTLTMASTQFFSNKKDNADIFSDFTGWSGSYQWNGVTISGSNSSTNDSSLTLSEVKDDDANTHFSINEINADGRSGASKKTFNTSYKTTLQYYVNNNSSDIVKSWLESIINKISTM